MENTYSDAFLALVPSAEMINVSQAQLKEDVNLSLISNKKLEPRLWNTRRATPASRKSL